MQSHIWSVFQMLLELIHETHFKMLTSELDHEALR